MSVHLHRAGRADLLAADLAELLAVPLADPFATEIVSVPTRGVERWLAQSLSRRLGRSQPAADDTSADPDIARTDGVCAGVAFWSPRRLIAQVGATLSGTEPGHDPWLPQRLIWPLVSILTEAQHQDWAAPVWRYLRRDTVAEQPRSTAAGGPPGVAGVTGSRRWATARHLGELLDRYLATRPEMIQRWRRGEDVDPEGAPLPASLAWQAECFRQLLGRISQPDPVARLTDITRLLASDPDRIALPERISVFGPTRLPPDQLRVLTALGEHRDVHLWLPHPSHALWAAVEQRLNDIGTHRLGPRAVDPTVDVARHRLLAYLGRDVRELQVVLDAAGVIDHGGDDHAIDQADVDHADGDQVAPNLLGRLQSDIGHDRALATLPSRAPLQPTDDSIGVHACHGPDRQVEVLRELLLDLLTNDPSLEPRDIIVMCPDIETFAPLISATFGVESDEPEQTHPGHQLRVRLADRSLRQLNPLLAVLGQLFDLATARIEASSILDLCASDPVAAKFGFSEDDILRLRNLVAKSGVRWGLDVADRRRFAMGDFAQNTWAAGLHRLLLGVTMDEEGEHYLGTTLPLDDVDAADVDLVGRLAEVVARIQTFLAELEQSRTLPEWMLLCRDGLDALTAAPPGDSWQLGQAYRELARLSGDADDHGTGDHGTGDHGTGDHGTDDHGTDDHGTGDQRSLLNRAEIRAVLQEAFRGRPSRANFRTGTLTMCTMLPMRSVPHRVVCLLGLDDGVFPRAGETDGDDITARCELVGDRDRRSEDRQLMLDAIMSAEEKLIIVYSGADPRTNADKPPSVPVGELLDVLDLTARTADGRPVRDQIVRRHPLQPFDPRNFDPTGILGDGPFSFDQAGLRGARALTSARAGTRATPHPGSSTGTGTGTSTPAQPFELPDLIELGEVVRFFNHPIKAYLRAQAGMYVLNEEEDVPEELPIKLDGLQSWAVGERLLELRLAGVDLERAVAAEWRRGSLPPRQLGVRTVDPVARNVAELVRVATPHLRGERDQREVNVPVEVAGQTHQVVGSLSDLVDERLVRVSYSRLAAKHRLRAWIELLALSASDPQTPWRAVIIGRGGQSILGPVQPAIAQLVLADLVELYRTGLSAPVPLPVSTAAEYARIRRQDRSVTVLRPKLVEAWKKEADAAFGLFYAREAADEGLAALEAERSIAAEERGGTGEPSRFGSLARRVWQPLLGAENLR